MVKVMMVNIKMIKNMAKVSLFGKMVENIWVNGLKENKMELELIYLIMGKRRWENGKMVKESDG